MSKPFYFNSLSLLSVLEARSTSIPEQQTKTKTKAVICRMTPPNKSELQGRFIQCAQCACAHEAPPHWKPHHQANVKTVTVKFVIETSTI